MAVGLDQGHVAMANRRNLRRSENFGSAPLFDFYRATHICIDRQELCHRLRFNFSHPSFMLQVMLTYLTQYFKVIWVGQLQNNVGLVLDQPCLEL